MLDISTNFNDVNAKGEIDDNDEEKKGDDSYEELSKSLTYDDNQEDGVNDITIKPEIIEAFQDSVLIQTR